MITVNFGTHVDRTLVVKSGQSTKHCESADNAFRSLHALEAFSQILMKKLNWVNLKTAFVRVYVSICAKLYAFFMTLFLKIRQPVLSKCNNMII